MRKHNRWRVNCESMFRINKNKGLILLFALLTLASVTAGGTLAYLATDTDPVINTFTPAKVASDVIEGTFDGNVKKNVKVANVGNTEAYIRAAIVVTWKANGMENTVSAIKPVKDTDYTIELNTGENGGWFVGDDGFYYHKEPVNHTGSTTKTSDLIIKCEPVAGQTPEGFELSVEIIASAIQSTPISVVQNQWGVHVDTENRNVLYK